MNVKNQPNHIMRRIELDGIDIAIGDKELWVLRVRTLQRNTGLKAWRVDEVRILGVFERSNG